jgi:transketolase
MVNRAADNIRILSIAAVERAKCGHPGGAMGGADFINILYSEFLKFDPTDISWPFRDRFFLDPGHLSALLYSQLTLLGNFKTDDLKIFRQWGSPTPGHPEKDVTRGIENTSGPLGQGHTMAVGAAIAAKFLAARFGDWIDHKIYTYISDGGIQEEISQGAGRIAGTLGLDNLIMFFDSNNIQLSTETWEVTSEDTAMKYKSWGWEVLTINGNNAEDIREALIKANLTKDKPTLIIGNTIMGKGALDENGDSFEGKCSTHGMPLGESGASFKKTLLNLGGDPENPFQIFPEVREFYKKVLDHKTKYASEKKKQISQWENANPELSDKLKMFLSGHIPEIDYTAIVQKENISTRVASSNVLSYYAQHIGNMIVSSADLSNSDKTDGFLKYTKAFRKGDFSGAFLQAGVSELTMTAITNGIALHGGVIAACATFFVFSDYMKPAMRLSALMELPVKFIWTHDAFRVGEDGPTHQPIEHEAQIRLLENLKNHHGKNSLLVLRPADANETTIAWKMAMENTGTPTGLIFSRQNIKDIPAIKGSSRYKDANDAQKGAYIVKDTDGKPDIILISDGSEVATCYECSMILSEKGINVRVVSAISEGLFRNQPVAYQKTVLPENIPIFGLTAGLPITLKGLAGPSGRIFGMESFGFSAPYTVLDEKLGYTTDNLVLQIEMYLADYYKS